LKKPKRYVVTVKTTASTNQYQHDRYNTLLFDQRPLLVHGRVTNDNGAVSLEVNRIEVLGRQGVGEAFALRYAAGM